MTRLDRRALFASGAAAALLAATGLSAAPVRGGRLRAALSGADRSDTWTQSPKGLFMQAAMQGAVFDTLTEIAPDGTLRGELATAWSSSEGGCVWTFDLRQDVVFHDEATLLVEDVIASLGTVGQVAATTAHQVRVTLEDPNPSLPMLLAQPNWIIRPADPARAEHGIGTGLYRVSDFEPGKRFIGTRVEKHWKDGTAGWFDSIEFAHVADEANRGEALLHGIVDVANVSNLEGLGPEFRRMPNDADGQFVISTQLTTPSVIGRTALLDNLRFAERWWMG